MLNWKLVVRCEGVRREEIKDGFNKNILWMKFLNNISMREG